MMVDDRILFLGEFVDVWDTNLLGRSHFLDMDIDDINQIEKDVVDNICDRVDVLGNPLVDDNYNRVVSNESIVNDIDNNCLGRRLHDKVENGRNPFLLIIKLESLFLKSNFYIYRCSHSVRLNPYQI